MRVPEAFVCWQKPISLCSWDKEHGQALIDCENLVADFDAVKDDCAARLGLLTERPSSADALFLDDKGMYVLVEFKSGGVNPKELISKIYDSAIILADEERQPPAWLRENVRFVLVRPAIGVGVTAEDRSDVARQRGLEALRRAGGRQLKCIIPGKVRGFFLRDTEEMTPKEFVDRYLTTGTSRAER